jgi:two-component system phosphate regulon response regulator OmpR
MTETKEHLLLVDDEDALRSVVAERLADEGFVVTQASDGASALKALDGFAFDVIVSDLRLPGVDGLASEASANEGRKVIETPST